MEVSKDLSDAFRQAVLQLDAWRPPSPEPTVPYGREHFPATGLCGFLNNEHFASARMPDNLIESILRLKKVDPNYMLTDYTFQGGARYVREIVEQRKRAFEQVQQTTGRSRGE